MLTLKKKNDSCIIEIIPYIQLHFSNFTRIIGVVVESGKLFSMYNWVYDFIHSQKS